MQRNLNHQLSGNNLRSPLNALKKGFDESGKRDEISASIFIHQNRESGKKIRNFDEVRNHVPQFIQRENVPVLNNYLNNNFDPSVRTSRLGHSNNNRQLFISPEPRMHMAPVQDNLMNGVRHKRLQAVNCPMPSFFSPLARN